MGARVAIVSRDDPPDLAAGRFHKVAVALRGAGFEPVGGVYDEAREAALADLLDGCEAVLAWVNPLQDGRSRAGLDALLRRAAGRGVLVGAHPDVIDRLGVKAVLAATHTLGWSGDAWFYATEAELRAGLPARLAAGPRVLKQNRGQSGLGIWRVEPLGAGRVRVMEARDRTRADEVPLADFLDARSAELAQVGGFVDQAFQSRLGEGMIRAYLSGGRVAGFGWQQVRALLDPDDLPTPPRTYSGPDDPRFQALRRRLDHDWVPRLPPILGLAEADLPVLWDADFLFGPPDAAGRDTFVLCEINASSVSPMPDTAAAAIAETLTRRLADGPPAFGPLWRTSR
ncbi:MAG: Cj0069 family protein [Pseudomonadota bacterium]